MRHLLLSLVAASHRRVQLPQLGVARQLVALLAQQGVRQVRAVVQEVAELGVEALEEAGLEGVPAEPAVVPAALEAPAALGALQIQAPQEVAQSAQFEGAVQRALAYLANVGAGAVELIIGCLVGRRLTASSTIDVCFKVQSDSREVSEEICKRLSYVQRRDVQYAIASELLNSDVQPDQVHVVYYRANRNPEAPANPNLGRPTDPSARRWKVRLTSTGEIKSVKPENLAMEEELITNVPSKGSTNGASKEESLAAMETLDGAPVSADELAAAIAAEAAEQAARRALSVPLLRQRASRWREVA
ncbi:unnamed protein product [Symbiodinium natans]|uniref:Uncharacterized protein n=1 Tax=Symbiodinium natans TaxID=878477 RepID=A0A812T324_9DINO|nr:unnamed protein product [Symbiodinium natans]